MVLVSKRSVPGRHPVADMPCLDRDAPVDMIVPAIPVHVVAQWLKLNIQKVFMISNRLRF
jgi:hypothetical protein